MIKTQHPNQRISLGQRWGSIMPLSLCSISASVCFITIILCSLSGGLVDLQSQACCPNFSELLKLRFVTPFERAKPIAYEHRTHTDILAMDLEIKYSSRAKYGGKGQTYIAEQTGP